MGDRCAICEQRLDSDTIVNVKLKGLLTLINASLERCDGKEAVFIRSDELKLHRKCRLNYAKEESIIRHKNEYQMHNRSEDVPKKLDYTNACLFCGQFSFYDTNESVANLTEEIRNSILQAGSILNNNWSRRVCLHLKPVNILERNAVYHTNCYKKYCHPLNKAASKTKTLLSMEIADCDELKSPNLPHEREINRPEQKYGVQKPHNHFICVDQPTIVKDESSLCSGCVSWGRATRPLNDKEEVMYSILTDNGTTFQTSVTVQFCWECRALLRRFMDFRLRIQRSQEIVRNSNYTESLSNIKVCKQTDAYTNVNYEINSEEIVTSLEGKHNFLFVSNHTTEDVDEKFIDTKSAVYEANDDSPLDNIDTLDNYNEIDKANDISDNSEPAKKDIVKATLSKTDKRFRGKFKIGKLGKDLNNYMTRKPMTNNRKVISKLNQEDLKTVDNLCTICIDSFPTKAELNKHMIIHEALPGRISCTQCPSYFDDILSLHCHELEHTHCLQCIFCRYRGVYRADMKLHLIEKHRRVVKCLSCGEVFKSVHIFKRHFSTCHSTFICDYCGHVSRSRRTLAKHINASHLPPVCGICKKHLATKKMLWYHMWRYHAPTADPANAYCVECDKQFPSAVFLRQHLLNSRKHAPATKTPEGCPHCGKTFSRRTYLKNHISLFHTKDSKFKCDTCDKQFFSGYALRTHKRRVHDKIPLVKDKICETCGRGFSSRRILTHHARTHTGERPHACARCPAAFAQRAALTAHVANVHLKTRK